MNRLAYITGALLALAPLSCAAQELRIGFLNTTSGPGAILGQDVARGWKLGLRHQGWSQNGDKLGGVPTKVYYVDDQQKVHVGITQTNRLIRSARVHLIVGNIWSNVLMAMHKRAIAAKVGIVSINAGPSPLAGTACSPYFISTSWNNDQMPEAMGVVLNNAPLRRVVLMAPNYQAGRDTLTGFMRTFKRKAAIAETLLFKFGQSDFQAEISKIRASNPDAVFLFAPGAMGIAFMKQWAASGANRKIKLYDVFTTNWVTLKPIGVAAIGSFHTNFWSPDSNDPSNQKFVKAYVAQYNRMPAHFAAQAYDAATLIATTVAKMKGRVGDVLALMKAMRKTKFASVRGPFKYNINGFPIQNFYLRKVIRNADGLPNIKTIRTVAFSQRDSYWKKCPPKRRY